MSDTETKTVKATVTRDFTDAGSEKRFTAGTTINITAGEFGNYSAAGLVEAVADDTAAANAGDPAKTGRTRS
ncbi:hypothetical protein [Sphingomonas sp. Leaf198]|uniref:hypothetical protein n=1 Tax=Sphingomonas sp. Leaf198 TaxID=1736299 RepID=UPI000ADB4349|nr:hypothetical protein [Sphingomonas sp. Leaf198]